MNISPTITSAFTTVCDRSVDRHFEIFRGKAGLKAIRDEWNRITQASDKLRFFQCYEWYESYLENLAEAPSQAYFVLIRQQGAPVGVIPLAQATRKIAGLRFRSLELVHHSHMPLSDGVFGRSDSDGTILQGLIGRLQRQSEIEWDLMCFTNLIEDGCIRQALDAAPIPRLISEERTRCNYISCIPFDELSKRFSKNFRANLRKARNKLGNLSNVEYISARRQPQLGHALNEFLDVEASGWKGASGAQTAIKLDGRLTNFYRSLCETFSAIDGCEINLLKADGRCLAGQFCLVVGDTSYILKIGYDESYVHLAPGNMLLEYSLQRYSSEGVVKFLNLVTDTPWHANWNPLSYAVSNAYVFNSTPAGLAAFALLRSKNYLRGKYKARLKSLVDRWRNVGARHSPNGGPAGNKAVVKEDA
jgi:CelD/BcsL family acetyltransferase involved in cellulose biosynthesis